MVWLIFHVLQSRRVLQLPEEPITFVLTLLCGASLIVEGIDSIHNNCHSLSGSQKTYFKSLADLNWTNLLVLSRRNGSKDEHALWESLCSLTTFWLGLNAY